MGTGTTRARSPHCSRRSPRPGALALPLLRALPGPARLVGARGRVAASADPAHLTGSLTRGPGFAAVLRTARTATWAGLTLVPWGGGGPGRAAARARAGLPARPPPPRHGRG
jgi:hypothetical protein